MPGMPKTDIRGGPLRIWSTSCRYGVRAMSMRRTRSLCPASGPPMMPAAASGLRSLSTRWAARSTVCQPSHRVGAAEPVSSSSAHSVARSSRAKLIPRWYAHAVRPLPITDQPGR